MAITNAEIKMVRSLAVKKFRQESGLFVVEGEKMVSEALASGFKVEKVFRRDDIGEEAMARISSLSSPSPALAVLRQPERTLPSRPLDGLCLGLDSVRDPGNLGTIIRLADWFGVSAIYAGEGTVETWNPKVIRSSMGSIFRVEVMNCSLPDVCKMFAEAGRKVYGTFLDGSDIYSSALAADGLLIMGNESDGISPAVAGMVGARLSIPSFAREGAGAESLNVAVAAGICLSEFRRRN